MLEFKGNPLFTYSVTEETVETHFYIYHLTTEDYLIQEEEPTGTLQFLGYDETGENEVWVPDVTIKQNFPLTQEALMMKLGTEIKAGKTITIPNEFLHVTSGEYENYKTGLQINNQPVYIGKSKKDGTCKILLGNRTFVQHLQTQLAANYQEEAPF
jgi:hypothetical protein